jgi:hypothetical protein
MDECSPLNKRLNNRCIEFDFDSKKQVERGEAEGGGAEAGGPGNRAEAVQPQDWAPTKLQGELMDGCSPALEIVVVGVFLREASKARRLNGELQKPVRPGRSCSISVLGARQASR